MLAASASHTADEMGSDTLGMLDLRVVIVPDGPAWFAQGLDVDYAAQGETVDDAKNGFLSGLASTLQQHLKVFGTIKGVLRVAPQEAWDLMYSAPARSLTLSQFPGHHVPWGSDSVLPFRSIQFIQSRHRSEAV